MPNSFLDIRVRNIEIYINIEHAVFESEADAFHVKVAGKPEEIKEPIQVGFKCTC